MDAINFDRRCERARAIFKKATQTIHEINFSDLVSARRNAAASNLPAVSLWFALRECAGIH
jgi:hypothetical protein